MLNDDKTQEFKRIEEELREWDSSDEAKQQDEEMKEI